MSTYAVMAVSDAEYAKADKDPNYSPQEHQVGTIEAPSEREALDQLQRAIKQGIVPKRSLLSSRE